MDPKNPILEEIHAVRDALRRACDFDVARIAAVVREHERANRARLVTRPPRRATPIAKAG